MLIPTSREQKKYDERKYRDKMTQLGNVNKICRSI